MRREFSEHLARYLGRVLNAPEDFDRLRNGIPSHLVFHRWDHKHRGPGSVRMNLDNVFYAQWGVVCPSCFYGCAVTDVMATTETGDTDD